MIQTVSQTLTQDLQTICNHFVTNSPFSWGNPLDKHRRTGIQFVTWQVVIECYSMVKISECTYLPTAAQRKTINKCLCCLPFHSEQQILSPSSHALLTRKSFYNWRHAADGRIGKMHKTQNYFFFVSQRGGGAQAGQAGPGRAVRFCWFSMWI